MQIIDIIEKDSKFQLLNIYNKANQEKENIYTLNRCLYSTLLYPNTILLEDFNIYHF